MDIGPTSQQVHLSPSLASSSSVVQCIVTCAPHVGATVSCSPIVRQYLAHMHLFHEPPMSHPMQLQIDILLSR